MHARFRKDLGLRSVLLSDPEREVMGKYDAMKMMGGFRTAYLIGDDGTIQAAHGYLWGVGRQVKKLLKALEEGKQG